MLERVIERWLVEGKRHDSVLICVAHKHKAEASKLPPHLREALNEMLQYYDESKCVLPTTKPKTKSRATSSAKAKPKRNATVILLTIAGGIITVWLLLLLSLGHLSRQKTLSQ